MKDRLGELISKYDGRIEDLAYENEKLRFMLWRTLQLTKGKYDHSELSEFDTEHIKKAEIIMYDDVIKFHNKL